MVGTAAVPGIETFGSVPGAGDVQVLFMSSPAERKVSYSRLVRMEAWHGAVCPLADSALEDPRGLAYYAPAGDLFVADYGQRKVFHYGIAARPVGAGHQCSGGVGGMALYVRRSQRTVVHDVLTQSVATDSRGDLFFADEERNQVSRLDRAVVQRLVDGHVAAEDLLHATGGQAAKLEAATGTTPPMITKVFWAPHDDHVSRPHGLALDGAGNLLWANAAAAAGAGGGDGGSTVSAGAGSLAYGRQPAGAVRSRGAPANTQGGAPATSALGSALDAAASYIQPLSAMVAYTTEAGSLMALCNGRTETVVLSSGFKAPRGLAWDGDSTLYVADAEGDSVVSVPTGSCRGDVPAHAVAAFRGVYGLAFGRVSASSSTRRISEDEGGPMSFSTWLTWLIGAR